MFLFSIGGGYGETREAVIAARYFLGKLKISAGYRWGKNSSAGDQILRDDLRYQGPGCPVTNALALNFAALNTLTPAKTSQTGVAVGILHRF